MGLLTVAVLLGIAVNAMAENVDWTNGGGDQLWSNGDNWQSGSVPGGGDCPYIIRINSADGIHIDISNKEIFKEIKRTNTDAIVCANDLTAAFLMRYLLDMGLRIPDNIAIVGFDDLPLAAHLPVPLTTIRQPLTALAYEAVSSAIERIENPNLPPRDIMVGTQLVIRSSCGAGKQIF
jgi:hypothetical protein